MLPLLHSIYTIACVAGPLAVLVYIRSHMTWRTRSHGRSLPPGPSPLPFIGNLLDMPSERLWLTFGEWADKEGEARFVGWLMETLDASEYREHFCWMCTHRVGVLAWVRMTATIILRITHGYGSAREAR